MSRYRIYQVDAFTTEKFRGNPAGVVPEADGLSAVQMQLIARELNNSETAFVLSPAGADHDVWVRFFTPTTEVPSCGHATIAAHYVRALEKQLPTCTVVQKIKAGILPVDVVKEGSDYRIVMTQGTPEFSEPLGAAQAEEILVALGLPASALDARCPIQIVSTGHSKVLVGIRSRETLNGLRPNLARLAEISGRIGCNGYFVFTLDVGLGRRPRSRPHVRAGDRHPRRSGDRERQRPTGRLSGEARAGRSAGGPVVLLRPAGRGAGAIGDGGSRGGGGGVETEGGASGGSGGRRLQVGA